MVVKYMKKLFLLITFSSSFIVINAQTPKIDSLLTALKAAKQDTTRYNILMALGDKYQNKNPDTATIYYTQAAAVANDIKDNIRIGGAIRLVGCDNCRLGKYKVADSILHLALHLAEVSSGIKAQKLKAAVLVNIGIVYMYESNYPQALDYYFKSLKINEEIGNRVGEAADLGNIGIVYNDESNYPQALDYLFKSLKMDEEIGDKDGQATDLGNIGSVYGIESKYSQELDYYFKSLKMDEDMGNKNYQANVLGNIGNVYQTESNYPQALDYYFKSLKMDEDMGNKEGQATNLGNIGVVYEDESNYPQALDYYFKALKMDKDMGNKKDQATNLGNIGSTYTKTGKFKYAEDYLKQAIALDSSIGDKYTLKDNEIGISQLYDTTHRYQLALEWFKKASILKDTLFNIDKDKAITRKELTYTFERQQDSAKAAQDKIDAVHNEVVKKQKVAIFSVSGGLVLVLLLAITIFRSLQQNRRKTEIIYAQKIEVEKKNKLIEEKNKDILDSINYAKRLQDAILPPLNVIKTYFPESFVLYKPKDIVAGDFYWLEKVNDTILIAACDCTGHGVPGAMVSVVCSNALNRAVKEFHCTEPGNILDKTRELVLETFGASGEVKDGMDISLCSITVPDTPNVPATIQWAGAYNPLWYLENGEIKELEPDKQPIGKTDNTKPFTTQIIKLQKGATLYLFTDGFADQFGGPKGKMFKYKQLEELLLANSGKPMEEQKNLLEQKFQEWIGELEQTDDVCVIGVRI